MRMRGLALATLAISLPCSGLAAQQLSGRIIDAANGAPVGFAAVFLLDAGRSPIVASSTDQEGNYRLEVPGAGEYYLVVERLGYFENETPLLAVGADGQYAVDMEMRPEPFRLDPLAVTVENEQLEEFLTLAFGQHPATLPGYRAIQGIRLEEAKLNSRDNTDLLRRLYVPVSHGRQVCIGTFGVSRPERTSSDRTNARAELPDPNAQCGALYVNDDRCNRLEHVEEIVMDNIAVVVTLEGSVHLYTRDFDWTLGGQRAPC